MRLSNLRILPVALIFVLASCDEEIGPVISSDPDTPAITAPDEGEQYVLTEDQAEQTLFTLEWTEADYGYDAAVQYQVHMDETGNNFQDYQSLGSSTGRSMDLEVSEINSALLALGFEGGQQADVQFRVTSSVDGAELEELPSEPLSFSITPYAEEVVISEIYVPGSYQSAGNYGNDWTPEDAPVLYSHGDDGHYEGYVYMPEADSEFKFTEERSWDVDWGDDEGDGTLDPAGANILHPDPGYYKINVDLNAMTYETLNTEWGLIGDATPDDWDADQDMSYDSDEHVWTITLDLTGGYVKFRANDDWALNYGDDEGDGTLSQDGADIPVDVEGNYTVILDLSGPEYTYELILN